MTPPPVLPAAEDLSSDDLLLERLAEDGGEVVVYLSTGGCIKGTLLGTDGNFLSLYRKTRRSPDGTSGPGELFIYRAHVVAIWPCGRRIPDTSVRSTAQGTPPAMQAQREERTR